MIAHRQEVYYVRESVQTRKRILFFGSSGNHLFQKGNVSRMGVAGGPSFARDVRAVCRREGFVRRFYRACHLPSGRIIEEWTPFRMHDAALLKSIHIDALRENARGHALAIAAA